MHTDIYFTTAPDTPVEVTRYDDDDELWFTVRFGKGSNSATLFVTANQLREVVSKTLEVFTVADLVYDEVAVAS